MSDNKDNSIAAEQVARAIAGMRGDAGAWSVLPGTLGEDWADAVPMGVRLAWERGEWEACIAALTRWHAELVAAETQRKAPDDTAPERLRERREALGWTRQEASADVRLGQDGIMMCEDPNLGGRELDVWRAAYAAALSAAEAERAAPALDPLAYADSPAWDEPPVRKPAPEVVDVPQPEPWHARLVRLAQEAQAASKACAEAEAAFTRADAVRETARLVRAAARETCHVKRQALTAATTAAAIVEAAQQPATAQPTRPEPRYKVGDWVRVVAGPNSARRINPIRVTCVTSAGYIMADGASWAAEHLTPALDPALHETARKTVAWLRGGARGTGPADFTTLPGWSDWNSGSRWDAAEHWAAQLERLLGDAP
jgi:hypothetical protein